MRSRCTRDILNADVAPRHFSSLLLPAVDSLDTTNLFFLFPTIFRSRLSLPLSVNGQIIPHPFSSSPSNQICALPAPGLIEQSSPATTAVANVFNLRFFSLHLNRPLSSVLGREQPCKIDWKEPNSDKTNLCKLLPRSTDDEDSDDEEEDVGVPSGSFFHWFADENDVVMTDVSFYLYTAHTRVRDRFFLTHTRTHTHTLSLFFFFRLMLRDLRLFFADPLLIPMPFSIPLPPLHPFIRLSILHTSLLSRRMPFVPPCFFYLHLV